MRRVTGVATLSGAPPRILADGAPACRRGIPRAADDPARGGAGRGAVRV